jgi:DNA modification methylase
VLAVPVVANTRARLRKLLQSDLNYHNDDSAELSHDFHSFPAKFPPQLPRAFIRDLTNIGDTVLDPMMGSGTCVLEACAADRVGIGVDLDPLAILLTKVKVSPLDPAQMAQIGLDIADQAERNLHQSEKTIEADLESCFDNKTAEFVKYWFSRETQLELTALIREIDQVSDSAAKSFLQLAFSAIIITKSGGVSLAWDLGHTRPHKYIKGKGKSYRSAFSEFKRRVMKNAGGLSHLAVMPGRASIQFGNAEDLHLNDNSVDLLFTSPPYPSNAIDYMRAHKFSLVWFGYRIDDLSELRSQYIGGEKTSGYAFLDLPIATSQIINRVAEADAKKGLALRRYYSEMRRVLSEAFRVLRPNCAAVFVVGSSIMRGIDTRVQDCLSEIGQTVGFEFVGCARRQLDRDRRMLPASATLQRTSQIEARMHEEHVIAFLKPSPESAHI